MMVPLSSFRIYLAARPVDFRKGMDGLAAHVANHFDLDRFCGAIYVFRSRSADRLKLLVWDGTGLVLVMKRMQGARFIITQASGRAGHADQGPVRGAVQRHRLDQDRDHLGDQTQLHLPPF